ETVNLPDNLLERLPHPLRQGPDSAVVSHADFLCPSHCREPDDICSYTRRRRPPALHRLLEENSCIFTPLILKSRQFSGGTGGFFPADLWDLHDRALSHLNTPLLIGTACKCHGIIDGIAINRPTQAMKYPG
ncbi:MAG: hypothetical protein V2I36_00550, partial [Desulfopila sp.]|nr:hypothetical protein [Desulfopila sp.]